jgi:hypothetical protein
MKPIVKACEARLKIETKHCHHVGNIKLATEDIRIE